MAERPKRAEEDQASEGEEQEEEEGKEQEDEDEEEEEEEDSCWEYDSTWEGDGEAEDGERAARESSEAASVDAAGRKNQDKPQPSWWPCRWGSGSQNASGRNWMAAKDMQKYRRHYPGLEEADIGEEDMWNLNFYKNQLKFIPRGLYIEDLLEKWQNDYVTLEENHSYIQWLFPLREPGMNYHARILTCQEIQAFKKSNEVMERFVRAYKLMLSFYGISLIDEETGELKRAENWCERFENLNWNSHNNLRITRILKCLGEMGFEHYQAHLVKFFLTETLVQQELPRVLKSALDYFMFTIRNKQVRQELVHFAWCHFRSKQEFVWGPHKKLRKFKPRSPGFLSGLTHREEQESALDGAGEAIAALPNDTCAVDYATSRTTCNLFASTKPSLPSNDSLPAKDAEKDDISAIGGDGLPTEDAAEHQTRPVSEPDTSEKTSTPLSAAAEKVRAEKEDSEESPPVSFGQLGKKDLSGECGSRTESKKRKLGKSRLDEASAGKGRGASDIEKISLNLGEVVLDQKSLDGRPFPKEKTKPLALEEDGESSRYMKESELPDAVVKRRKVEEMLVEDGSSNVPTKVDIKMVPTKGLITNFSVPGIKRTDQICQDETKTVDSASVRTVGVDLLFPSKSSPEHGFPQDSCLPDEVNRQKIASALASERCQLDETLHSSGEKGVSDGREEDPDVEGKAGDAAAENILAKTEEDEKSVARAEEK